MQQFKSSLHKLDPLGKKADQRAGKQLSLRSLSAAERGDATAYARCSSRRIGHEGPDVPLPRLTDKCYWCGSAAHNPPFLASLLISAEDEVEKSLKFIECFQRFPAADKSGHTWDTR